MNKRLIRIVIGLLLLSLVGWWVYQSPEGIFVGETGDESGPDRPVPVTDFASCAANGHPVSEAFPRSCDFNGVTYLEL